MKTGAQEPWNFRLFVRHYNEIAKARGGWIWPGEIRAKKLRGWYEEAGLWKRLRTFALTRYQLDQEI